MLTTTTTFTQTPSRYDFSLQRPKDKVERMIDDLMAVYARLEALDTIDARPENVKLYRSLFDLLTKTKATAAEDRRILNDPRVLAIGPRLWEIWGNAEYMVERDFAHTILSETTGKGCRDVLNSYTSLARYRQIARMEVNTIDTALGEYGLPPVKKVAFLGSGPMPYTSICFQERYGPEVSFLNIDRNPEAIQLGSQVLDRCGFKNIAFEEADAAQLTTLNEYDVVHFAALIGASPEQRRDLLIAVTKSMRPGALLLVRTTDSLRTLLYPRIELDDPKIRSVATPVVATRYYGGTLSLSSSVIRVEGPGAPGEMPFTHL